MEKELENIVIQKAFEELTSTEREQLNGWCSTEEEFNQLKMLYSEIELMNSTNTIHTKSETKKRLDNLFEETNRKGIWYKSTFKVFYPVEKSFFQRPLVQLAALIVLIFIAIPLFTNKVELKSNAIAKLETESQKTIIESKPNEVQTEINSQSDLKFSPPLVEMEEPNSNQFKDEMLANDMELSSDVSAFSEAPLMEDEKSVVSKNEKFNRSEMGASAPVTAFGFANHSDGIFVQEDSKSNYKQSAAKKPEVLDLLTAAF